MKKFDEYHCAQSVVYAFSGDVDIDKEYIYLGTKHGGISRFNTQTHEVEIFSYDKSLVPSG